MQKKYYKTVFVSDIHLGNPKNQSNKLIDFLKSISTDQLIIVGDFIDYRQLKRFWKWTNKEIETLNFINELSINGTKITYIQWNHDKTFECINNIHLENINIRKDLIYKSWNWKTYYITHWHNLDNINSSHSFIWKIWSFFYWLLLKVEYLRNKKCILPLENSIAETIEQWIKIHRFPKQKLFKVIKKFAKDKPYNWIILWHFHQPTHDYIDDLEYINTWDWLKNCSAIIENKNWDLESISIKK